MSQTNIQWTGTTNPNHVYINNPKFEIEKKIIFKLGFKHNKKTNEWRLNLSTNIKIPCDLREELLADDINAYRNKLIINKLKQLKQQMIDKLTAKIILAELIKPHKIKI